jgi:hypothetical protein
MSNQDIIATLKRNGIATIGDLDSWARVRRLNRWQALGVLVGVEAADRVFGALAVRLVRLESSGDHWQTQYQSTGDRGGALL